MKGKDSHKSGKFEVRPLLFPSLMEVLPKDIIVRCILPHLPVRTGGRPLRVAPVELVEAILYKLKTGCQWRFLPVKQFFSAPGLRWQAVYYHFNQWRKNGSWKNLWVSVLQRHKRFLDLSSVQLDGSHTPAKNGGAAVGYQGRKKARTTTQLLLTDNAGQPLASATPQAGNHHDLFHIEELFEQLCCLLEAAEIDLQGLFLNADSAFDAPSVRRACARRGLHANLARNPRGNGADEEHYVYFDEQLYQRRTVAEHANAWLDSFKTLLVRYETTVDNWLAFHWLAFVVLFLRRISKIKTS